MSQATIKITLVCEPDVETDIENAMLNSGVQFSKVSSKEPKTYVLYVPDHVMVASLILHVLESKKEDVKGNIEFANGQVIEINEEGIGELRTMVLDSMSKKREEQPKNQENKGNVEWISELLNAVIPLADKYLTFKENDAKAKKEYFERVSNHNRRMVYALVSFLAIIIALMSGLTYFKLVSGDALLFLVGTVTGYLLLFIQRLVFPSEEPATQEIPT